MSRRRALLLIASVAGLAASGCQGPRYAFEDLPGTPVALVFRTMAESDQVFDYVLENEKRLRQARTGRVEALGSYDKNRVDAEALGALVGIGGLEDRASATLGRLTLLDARTGELTPVEWAKRGSRPAGWSPDRSRLLYITMRRGSPQVFERNLRTEESQQVTHDRLRYIDATYCGDDTMIFSAADPSGRFRLYLRRAGAGSPTGITELAAAYAPACDASGKAVFFETLEARGQEMIARLDLDDPSAAPVVLTRGRHPAVTPDGEWVVYSARARGGWKLWRMRPDGSGRHPLGRSSRWEQSPAISPDGRYVVFTATEGERPVRQQLWVRPLDGDDDRPLRVQGDALHPAW